jgi:hypothetical protein
MAAPVSVFKKVPPLKKKKILPYASKYLPAIQASLSKYTPLLRRTDSRGSTKHPQAIYATTNNAIRNITTGKKPKKRVGYAPDTKKNSSAVPPRFRGPSMINNPNAQTIFAQSLKNASKRGETTEKEAKAIQAEANAAAAALTEETNTPPLSPREGGTRKHRLRKHKNHRKNRRTRKH